MNDIYYISSLGRVLYKQKKKQIPFCTYSCYEFRLLNIQDLVKFKILNIGVLLM